MRRYCVLVFLTHWLIAFDTNRATAVDDVPALPNVVIIFADDLGYGDLGVTGATGYKTPNLDRMSKEGVSCTNFYVAAPVCSASRAALLTGRYPIRTGVTGVISANSKLALPLAEITLAERFKANGYATAIFGKWHLGNSPDAWPLQQGFDEWFGTIGSNDMGRGKPSLEQRRKGKAGVELVEGQTVIEFNPDQRFLTRRYTEKAVDFIRRSSSKPFFLYLPHNMPHTPLFASDRFKGATIRGLYGDVVAELDWSVGQILSTLKQENIDDKTIVIFTSDNGPWLIFGDHGGSASPFSGGKKQTLEGGMRVPMIARWPAGIPAGRVCDRVVTTMDLTPTLANLTGIETDVANVDGVDVSPEFRGQSDGGEAIKPFFYFWGRELQAVRHGDWKLRLEHTDTQSPDPDSVGYGGLRGGVRTEQRSEALFNLASDPGEQVDLSTNHPGVLAKMRQHASVAERITRSGR